MQAQYKTYDSYKDSGEAWIGRVPEHWESIKLKHLFYEKKHSPNISLGCGSISFGEVVEKDDERVTEATKASYQEVLEGEFLINPLNLNYDLKSLRIALSKINVVVSAGYLVIKEKAKINKNYFKYLLHRFDVDHMKLMGSGVRQTINFGHIANSLLINPPLDEQSSIADFLDQKTAEIDAAIEKKQRLIELLKEQKSILINQAVTKGLNPSAPMKDSGIEWIGEIPAHWKSRRNQTLFQQRKVLVGKKSSEFTLLSLTLRGIIERDMDNPEGKFPAEFDTYQIVCPGDFVFCHFDVEETPRTVGLSTLRGMITGAYTVYECLYPDYANYLEYLYLCLDERKMLGSLYTGLRNTIPKTVFSHIHSPIPPQNERIEIIKHIHEVETKTNAAISLVSKEVIKLQEFKQTLIAHAVTGKIKV